jgi:hypothetical protein
VLAVGIAVANVRQADRDRAGVELELPPTAAEETDQAHQHASEAEAATDAAQKARTHGLALGALGGFDIVEETHRSPGALRRRRRLV